MGWERYAQSMVCVHDPIWHGNNAANAPNINTKADLPGQCACFAFSNIIPLILLYLLLGCQFD
jgi:hypothetical protein